MENLNFFLYDLLPKFLLGGVIGFGIVMIGCLLIIFPVLFYTIGDAVINGTFWEWVNGLVLLLNRR